MPKRTIIFWTTPELKQAKECLIKNNNNVSATTRELTKKLKRPATGIMFKLHQIKKIANPVAGRKTRVMGRKDRPKNALELPKGFSFDFTPKRAEMFQDHVRLYF
jgi:hypothetical protein